MERVTTLLAFSSLFGLTGAAGAAAGAGVAAPGAATAGAPGIAAGADAAGAAPAAAGAFFGSSAKAAAATVRVKLAAMMIFLKVMSYPPFLKMKFVDKFFGQPVKILVGHVGIVVGQSPGDKKLGQGEDVAEVDDTDYLDLEETRCIGCSDGEQEVIRGGEDPPAEKERLFFVMKLNEFGVFCNCCPVILSFCHELLLSFNVRCTAQGVKLRFKPPFQIVVVFQALDKQDM
jgi:hypothetical protein